MRNKFKIYIVVILGVDNGGERKMPWSYIDRIEEELGLVPRVDDKRKKRRLLFF